MTGIKNWILAVLTAALLVIRIAPAQIPSFNADRIAPNYPISYVAAKAESVREVLNRIHSYLESSTPARLVDAKTNEPVLDVGNAPADTLTEPGDCQPAIRRSSIRGCFLACSPATAKPRYS